MPSYIPDNFKPDDATLLVLRQEGIFEDFLQARVTKEFIEYWQELKAQKLKKGQKTAWQTCYRRWARRAFMGKAGKDWEENRHRRQHGGPRNDLFGQIFDGIKNPVKEFEDIHAGLKIKVVHTPIPGEGETATFEDFSKLVRRKK